MDNLAYRVNRYIVAAFVIAPFAAFFTESYLDMSFYRIMQSLSFIGVFLIIIYRNNSIRIKFPTYLIYYLLFIIYVFYSAFIQLERNFEVGYLFSNPLIGAFNMMFIIENLPIKKEYYKSIIKVSKIILPIAFLVIVIQQAINPNFFVRIITTSETVLESDNENRLLSIYSWISDLAVGFGFVPIFILIVEDLDKKKKKILIWILLGVFYAILTKARWVMLMTLLVFVIVFMNHENNVKQFAKYLFVIPFIIFISSITLDSVGIDVKSIINERILESDKKDFSQKSASTRILAFEAFDKFFWDQPLFGKGDIRFGMGANGQHDYKLKRFLRGRSSQMHVGYLSLLYLYGLIGAFLFLSFLFLILRKLYKNSKSTGIWAPFLGFIGFAMANLTLVTFSVFEMGLIVVLVANKYYSQSLNIREKNV